MLFWDCSEALKRGIKYKTSVPDQRRQCCHPQDNRIKSVSEQSLYRRLSKRTAKSAHTIQDLHNPDIFLNGEHLMFNIISPHRFPSIFLPSFGHLPIANHQTVPPTSHNSYHLGMVKASTCFLQDTCSFPEVSILIAVHVASQRSTNSLGNTSEESS